MYRLSNTFPTVYFFQEEDKSPRGYFLFSTWRRNDSSEVSFDSSEEFFLAHVDIFYFPRGDLKISTWIFEKGWDRTNFPVKICK